jgi:peptidylprolyl isomerase
MSAPRRTPGARARLAALAGAAIAFGSPAPAAAGPGPARWRSTNDILDTAPPSAWRPLDPEDTLYLDLPGGRVVVELAPAFAPRHVANVKALARSGWYDGLSVNRVQDGFVAQWGDPDAGDPAKARPLGGAAQRLPAEATRASAGLAFRRLPDADGYAPQVGFVAGFPVGRDPRTGRAWIAHCYGVVAAGREDALDSSNGTELYAVIGQAPRQLDRNATVVGRVVSGMEHLSSLPRGTGAMGFHERPERRIPVVRVRVAADVPEAERTPLEAFRTDGPLWDALVESRRNRRDAWYHVPAGHVDLCNVPIPVRRAPPAQASGSPSK